MVYTTYLSKMKDLPGDAYKVIISRYLPSTFHVNKKNREYHVPDLAPSHSLLKEYKDGVCSWDDFVQAYNREMESSPFTTQAIQALVQTIKEHRDDDIFLICYEKDANKCHRSLLASFLKENYEINCVEWNGEK